MIENAMIAVQDRLLELLPEKIAYLAEDWGRVLGLHAKGATGRGDPDRTGSALRSRKHFSPRTEP